MQVTGIIENIYTKTITIKRGPRSGQDTNVYHAELSTGHDVNLGFKHNYVVGESVAWELEEAYGDYKIVDNKGGSTVSNGAEPISSVVSSKTSVKRNAFPVNKNSKDMSIIRQNSGQHASRIVAALIQSGAIKNEAEAMDTFFQIVYEITDFATGHREMAQVAAMTAMEE